jgi:hypothetical protein
MSFWAERLGGAPRPPVPPSAPQASSAPWWAAPAAAPADASAYGAPLPPPPAASQTPVRVPTYQRQAQGSCPECGGEDFFQVDARQGPRCYDCGYCGGNRTRNSTQGTPAVASQATAGTRAARQVPGAGFRPDVIVGHV